MCALRIATVPSMANVSSTAWKLGLSSAATLSQAGFHGDSETRLLAKRKRDRTTHITRLAPGHGKELGRERGMERS
jgi:hypothetical protein